MTKYIILIILSFSLYNSYSQNYSSNLQKYWWYRYRLVNDFMKVGLDFGESIPAELRSYSGAEAVTQAHVHWGDATQKIGNYLVLLATKYELYCAIKALDRIDLYMESHCRDFALTEDNNNLNPVTSGSLPYKNDLNGFLGRDDVPRKFIVSGSTPNANFYHFNRPGVCKQVFDVQSDLVQRTDSALNPSDRWAVKHPNLPRYPLEESQDQFEEFYKGLALVVALVPSSAKYNGQVLRDMAKVTLLRASMYINSVHGQWKIYNPLTQLCVYGVDADTGPDCTLGATSGANASGLAGGIGAGLFNLPAGWSSTENSQINNLAFNWTNLTPPQIALWQAQKLFTVFPCGTDGPLFTATVATFANNWLFHGLQVTRTQLNKMSLHCDLAYPQLPLIYRLLHGGPLFKPEAFPAFKDSYETRLDAAPKCGIYNYFGNVANNEWSSPDRQTEATKRANISDRSKDNAEYPGMDYMSIFNLHVLNKGSYASFYNNPYYRENLSQTYPYTLNGITYGNSANPTSLQYLEYLSTTSHVTPAGRVTYRAAKQIEILPGFQADYGSNFLAYIKDYDCSGCKGKVEAPPSGSTNFRTNAITMQEDKDDAFVMDTVEDVVPFVPPNIPDFDSTNDYEMTDADLRQDSIDVYQQIVSSGDQELIDYINHIFGYSSAGVTASRRTGAGVGKDLTSEKLSVDIYPNPNKGSFTIKIGGNGSYDLDITNIYGTLVFKGKITGGSSDNIVLPNVLSGSYQLRIRKNNLSVTRRIVVYN